MKPVRRSAGAVVVRRVPDGWRYLLLRAWRNWDFPKGLIETGERPEDAARREIAEETGLTDLRWLQGPVYIETPPYAGGKIARYYLAQTEHEHIELPVSAELGRPEHHEYRWLSHEQARSLLVPRLRSVLDWAAAQLANGNR